MFIAYRRETGYSALTLDKANACMFQNQPKPVLIKFRDKMAIVWIEWRGIAPKRLFGRPVCRRMPKESIAQHLDFDPSPAKFHAVLVARNEYVDDLPLYKLASV